MRAPSWNQATGPTRPFQSHAGSIEGLFFFLLSFSCFSFQSHAGSIEGRGSAARGPARGRVSIPRWFD
ncbi:MAG: hypothetical protein NZ572_08270 [Thermoflexus sp.]|nr:hypothetical protein [Thermoflexus sp.]